MFFFQVLNSVLSLLRQVVETNLVAFDCHWILINEVSIEEIMYGSGFDFGGERRALKAFDFFSLATFSTSDQNLKLPLM